MLFCSGLQEAYHRTHDVMDPTSANTNPGASLLSQITFLCMCLYRYLDICCVNLTHVNSLCYTFGHTPVKCLSSQQSQWCKPHKRSLCCSRRHL